MPPARRLQQEKQKKKDEQDSVIKKAAATRAALADLRKKKAEADAAEHEQFDKTIEAQEQELRGQEEEMKRLDEETKMDIDEPEPEIKTESTGEPSVLQSVEGTGQTPQINVQGAGGNNENPIDLSGDPDDLITPAQFAANIGQGRDRVPQVWKNCGRGRAVVIVQYGPRNSAKYRREPTDTDFDDDDAKNITDPSKRPGERCEYKNNIKVWERTKKNFVSIQGIALPVEENPLDAVNPDLKGRAFKPLEILIKWKLSDGSIDHSWETRTVFRRLWASTKKGEADEAIQGAAIAQEKRYEDWENGTRTAQDRSPTPNAEIFAALRQSKTPEPPVSNKSAESSKTTNVTKPDEGSQNSATPAAAQPQNLAVPPPQPATTESGKSPALSENQNKGNVGKPVQGDKADKTPSTTQAPAFDPKAFMERWALMYGKDPKNLSPADMKTVILAMDTGV